MTVWAIGLAGALWRGLAAYLPHAGQRISLLHAEQGESLLHGLRLAQVPLTRMPIGLLLQAVCVFHASPEAGRLVVGAFALASVLLVILLGWLLEGPWCGFLAASLWLLCGAFDASRLYYSFFFTPFVLLAAGFAILAGARPSRRAALGLAVAIGSSLLYRSTLALLAPVLAILAALRPGWPARRRLSEAALLLVVPFLFLAPWIRMNWRLQGRLIPFEGGQAAGMNIATAALGAGATGTADLGSLLPKDESGDSLAGVLPWAAREVAAQPGRYARGLLERLRFVLGLHPWLWAAALAGFWLRRKEERFRMLGLFCAYFVAVHCAMAVTAYYFLGLWPLLCLAAAAVFSRALPATGEFPSRLLWLVLAPALALNFFADGLLGLYGRTAAPEALERGLSRSPDCAWLLYQRGRAELAASDPRAQADLSRAAALQPGLSTLSLERAWALAQAGDANALLSWPAPEETAFEEDGTGLRIKACLYKAALRLRLKQAGEARKELEEALLLWRKSVGLFEVRSRAERALQARFLADSDARFLAELGHWLDQKPAADRLAVLREAMMVLTGGRAAGGDAELELAYADQAAHAGDAAGAREVLAAIRPSLKAAGLLRRAAAIYEKIGAPKEALVLLLALLRDSPGDARLRADVGLCQYLAGEPEEAVWSLKAAIAQDPDLQEAYLSLGNVYRLQGREREAREVFDAALARSAPEDEARRQLRRARAELAAGRDRR